MKILLAGTAANDYGIPFLSAKEGPVRPKEGVELAFLWTPNKLDSSLTIAITEENSGDSVDVCLNLGAQVHVQGKFFSDCALTLDRIMTSQALEDSNDMVARAIAELAGNQVCIERSGEFFRFYVSLGESPAPTFIGRIEAEEVQKFFDIS